MKEDGGWAVEIVPLTRLQHITGDGFDVEDVVNEVAEDGIDELEDMLLEELEVDMELVVVIVKLQIAPLADPKLKEIAPMAYFM